MRLLIVCIAALVTEPLLSAADTQLPLDGSTLSGSVSYNQVRVQTHKQTHTPTLATTTNTRCPAVKSAFASDMYCLSTRCCVCVYMYVCMCVCICVWGDLC